MKTDSRATGSLAVAVLALLLALSVLLQGPGRPAAGAEPAPQVGWPHNFPRNPWYDEPMESMYAMPHEFPRAPGAP